MSPPRCPIGSRSTADIIESVANDADAQSVIVCSEAHHDRTEFAESVFEGLTASPPYLHCRYLYDAEGSRLFDEICRTPEYYPTRTEDGILARNAPDIRTATGPVTLIELGSGSSVKTDRLLTAYTSDGSGVLYVPVDVSRAALEHARSAIVERHPEVTVTAIVGTYEEAFPLFRRFSPSMVLFLGSTVGNLNEEEWDTFWGRVGRSLEPGDYFLLGVDLIKDKAVLDAAYNDAAGHTEAFTRNLFRRINRELGATVDLHAIRHVAEYVPERERVEIFAEFLSEQVVRLEPLDRSVVVPAGTRVMTEISRKFRVDEVAEQLAGAGFATRQVFTDDRGWFGLLLLQRVDD